MKHNLTLKSFIHQTKKICLENWKILIFISAGSGVVVYLLRLIHPFSILGSLASLAVVIIIFFTYYILTKYILGLVGLVEKKNWRALITNIDWPEVYRIMLANAWMTVVVLWPAMIIAALILVLSMLIDIGSTAGIIAYFLSLGIVSIITVIISIMRSLKFVLIPYLAFTTQKRITNLHQTSGQYMEGNRIAYLKILLIALSIKTIILFIELGILSALVMIIFLPILYIVKVLFTKRVIENYSDQNQDEV